MKKIAVVSTSRADFAHLHWPLVAMSWHPDLDPHVISTCAHLSPEFGDTGELVQQLGLPIIEVEALMSSDTDVGMAKTIGVATLGLADVLGRLRPDILLLVADRYEMLAPASTALALRIPMAHIEGGEVSEGAIDDAVRNALTKMSHLHFTPRARPIAPGPVSSRWARNRGACTRPARRRSTIFRTGNSSMHPHWRNVSGTGWHRRSASSRITR